MSVLIAADTVETLSAFYTAPVFLLYVMYILCFGDLVKIEVVIACITITIVNGTLDQIKWIRFLYLIYFFEYKNLLALNLLLLLLTASVRE